MGKMKRYNSAKAYIEDQPDETQGYLNDICAYILEAVPEAEEVSNCAAAAFALVKGGKMDKQIMVAGLKKHIGFYPHPTTIEHFADELKGYQCSKGTVQFLLGKPLPKELIIKMVKYLKEQIDKM